MSKRITNKRLVWYIEEKKKHCSFRKQTIDAILKINKSSQFHKETAVIFDIDKTQDRINKKTFKLLENMEIQGHMMGDYQ